VATRRTTERLTSERGDALIDGLLALMLVLLVIVFAAQALAYAQARLVAEAAAQDGASAAATDGTQAGVARATAVLGAAGGVGSQLHATAGEQDNTVTITVAGSAPRLFAVSLLLPEVRASATLPVESYPQGQNAP
jgi:hypothetical protein